MKKAYVKPCMTVELFVLTQSIAQHCGWHNGGSSGHPTHADLTVCGWQDVIGETYWTSLDTCDGVYDENLEIEDGCFNAPCGSQQVFAS